MEAKISTTVKKVKWGGYMGALRVQLTPKHSYTLRTGITRPFEADAWTDAENLKREIEEESCTTKR